MPIPAAIVTLMFVVEGVLDFTKDVNTVHGSLDKLRASLSDNIFTDAVKGITNSFSEFGDKLWDIASVTIGVLLRDAFNWLLETLKEIIASAFEAGAAFQLVEMRLKGLTLQAAIDSGLSYADAMKASIDVTKEQLDWIMKLAAITPYDAEDIAKTFTMATAFGFNATAAKELTESILDFTAAMGLGSQEQERIIVNFGQMIQRGKITTREMNDLARGSLLPLADVLKRVVENSKGAFASVATLTAAISKPGGGVDPQLFIDAFNEMVNSEERFSGAAVRMAHTFAGSTENIRQSLRDVIGFFILLPGFLDPVGQRLGDIMDEVGNRWGEIIDAAGRVGAALAPIINGILDLFLPGAGTIVDSVVGGLDSIANWLTDNKENILGFFRRVSDFLFGTEADESGNFGTVGALQSIKNWIDANGPQVLGFFTGIGTTIQKKIVALWEEKLKPAYDDLSNWVTENKGPINEFFSALGDIVSDVINGLLGIKSGHSPATIHGVLDKILEVMKWVTDNKESIASFVESWVRFWIFAELIKFLLSEILGFVGALLALDVGAWGLLWLGIKMTFGIIKETVAFIWETISKIMGAQMGPYFGVPIPIWELPTVPPVVTPPPATPPVVTPPVVNPPGVNPPGVTPMTPMTPFVPPTIVPQVTMVEGPGILDKLKKIADYFTGDNSQLSISVPQNVSGNTVSSVTSSTTNATSNYNLTINTMASNENIIQDYASLKAIAV